MTPEEAAVVVRMLRRQVAGDPVATCKLRAALQYAAGPAVRLVADRTYPTARFAASICAFGIEFEPRDKLIAYLASRIDLPAAELRQELEEAAEEVVYAVSWMLEHGEPPERVRAAANAARGPLADWQVSGILRREWSWWKRTRERQEMQHAA